LRFPGILFFLKKNRTRTCNCKCDLALIKKKVVLMAMEISRSLAGHEEGTRRRMGLAVWGFAYPGTISDEAIGMWVGEMFSHEYKGNWGSMWWPGGSTDQM
jgi:hypothetical protein